MSNRLAKYLVRLMAVILTGVIYSCSGVDDVAGRVDSSGNSRAAVDSLIAEGDIYYSRGYYSNSLSSLTEALKIAGRDSLRDVLPLIYNNIGKVYCTWNHDPLGIEYFRQGLAMPEVRKSPSTYRKLLMNVQGAAYNIGDTVMLRTYYDEMCRMAHGDSLIQYFVYLNRGLILRGHDREGEADTWFAKAARHANSRKMPPVLESSALGYIATGKEESNPDEALSYWKQSIASDSVPPFFERDALRHMAALCERLGRTAEGMEYTRRYLELTDSLFKESDMNRARDAQMLYERELAADRIERLDAENNRREQRIRVQMRVIAWSVAAALVLAVLFMLIYIQKRRLRQSYTSLFERNKEILHLQQIDRLRREQLEKRIDTLEQHSAPEEDTDASLKTERRHSVDRLTDEQRERILRAIEKTFDDIETICDPDFSIERLADITDINSRYLSQVINDTYNRNFRSLLNEHRIREVQRRLLDTERWGSFTIQAIIQSVGYKSQSNFNKIFKQHTGVTPSMYCRMVKKDNASSDDK